MSPAQFKSLVYLLYALYILLLIYIVYYCNNNRLAKHYETTSKVIIDSGIPNEVSKRKLVTSKLIASLKASKNSDMKIILEDLSEHKRNEYGEVIKSMPNLQNSNDHSPNEDPISIKTPQKMKISSHLNKKKSLPTANERTESSNEVPPKSEKSSHSSKKKSLPKADERTESSNEVSKLKSENSSHSSKGKSLPKADERTESSNKIPFMKKEKYLNSSKKKSPAKADERAESSHDVGYCGDKIPLSVTNENSPVVSKKQSKKQKEVASYPEKNTKEYPPLSATPLTLEWPVNVINSLQNSDENFPNKRSPSPTNCASVTTETNSLTTNVSKDPLVNNVILSERSHETSSQTSKKKLNEKEDSESTAGYHKKAQLQLEDPCPSSTRDDESGPKSPNKKLTGTRLASSKKKLNLPEAFKITGDRGNARLQLENPSTRMTEPLPISSSNEKQNAAPSVLISEPPAAPSVMISQPPAAPSVKISEPPVIHAPRGNPIELPPPSQHSFLPTSGYREIFQYPENRATIFENAAQYPSPVFHSPSITSPIYMEAVITNSSPMIPISDYSPSLLVPSQHTIILQPPSPQPEFHSNHVPVAIGVPVLDENGFPINFAPRNQRPPFQEPNLQIESLNVDSSANPFQAPGNIQIQVPVFNSSQIINQPVNPLQARGQAQIQATTANPHQMINLPSNPSQIQAPFQDPGNIQILFPVWNTSQIINQPVNPLQARGQVSNLAPTLNPGQMINPPLNPSQTHLQVQSPFHDPGNIHLLVPVWNTSQIINQPVNPSQAREQVPIQAPTLNPGQMINPPSNPSQNHLPVQFPFQDPGNIRILVPVWNTSQIINQPVNPLQAREQVQIPAPTLNLGQMINPPSNLPQTQAQIQALSSHPDRLNNRSTDQSQTREKVQIPTTSFKNNRISDQSPNSSLTISQENNGQIRSSNEELPVRGKAQICPFTAVMREVSEKLREKNMYLPKYELLTKYPDFYVLSYQVLCPTPDYINLSVPKLIHTVTISDSSGKNVIYKAHPKITVTNPGVYKNIDELNDLNPNIIKTTDIIGRELQEILTKNNKVIVGYKIRKFFKSLGDVVNISRFERRDLETLIKFTDIIINKKEGRIYEKDDISYWNLKDIAQQFLPLERHSLKHFTHLSNAQSIEYTIKLYLKFRQLWESEVQYLKYILPHIPENDMTQLTKHFQPVYQGFHMDPYYFRILYPRYSFPPNLFSISFHPGPTRDDVKMVAIVDSNLKVILQAHVDDDSSICSNKREHTSENFAKEILKILSKDPSKIPSIVGFDIVENLKKIDPGKRLRNARIYDLKEIFEGDTMTEITYKYLHFDQRERFIREWKVYMSERESYARCDELTRSELMAKTALQFFRLYFLHRNKKVKPYNLWS